MKKYLIVFVLSVCILACCLVLCACDDNLNDDNKQDQQLTQLAAPIVNVSADGTITWSRVPNANRYVVYVNGSSVFTTSGFSFQYNQTEMGTYSIQVVATDYLNKYMDSRLSDAVTYAVNKQKLSSPQLIFDGESLVFDSIPNATGYRIYVDRILTENVISTENNLQRIELSLFEVGSHTVEARAIGDGNTYIDSDISTPITVHVADNSTQWNAENIITNWSRNTDIAITKPNATEVMFWVDNDAYKNSYIENYIKIPADAKSIVLSCFASASLENAVIDLQIREYNGEYEQMTIQGENKLILSCDRYDKYYFAIPSQYVGANVFLRLTVNTAGTFQTQAVFNGIFLSQDTEFVPPQVQMNVPLLIRSVSQNKYLQYDTDKGYVVLADNQNSASPVMFVSDGLGDGYFRIRTQNGLYLTRTMLLTEGNVAWDYIIQAPYQEDLMTQVWSARFVEGSYLSFTLVNHGSPYTENGETKYMVLNAYYPQLDNVCMWYDIVASDLEFELVQTDAEFDSTAEFIEGTAVDFSKPVFAYFAGRNAALTIKEGYLTLGNLMSKIDNLAEYSWSFELAQEGYYYIKNSNGNYLYTVKVGTSYFIAESSSKENASSFLFKATSRGGNMYYLSNKFVDEDSNFIQYLVFDVNTNKIAFYTDLITNADQIIKFVNV